MPGKPIKIGPFTGGLNNISTAGESEDNELVELVNMEVTKDQSLTSRPPISVVPGSSRYFTNLNMGWDILGIYRVSDTEWHLIVSVGVSENSTDTQIRAYRNGIVGVGESVSNIKTIAGASNRVTGMTQFRQDLIFIVGPNATANGFRWKLGDLPTDLPTLPKGNIIISWKTRVWVSGTSTGANADRIWFSFVGAEGPDPFKFEAQAFFDVAPGEGGYVTALVSSFNNLIVFKNDGTWRFSYPASPKQGTIDKISGQIGASGKHAAAEFENYIYVYDQGYVYELVNSNFSQLNSSVMFHDDPEAVDGAAPGVEISIVNRRLIVRYYNALYVFTIDTKAWSQWRSFNGVPGRFQELPVNSARADPSVYYAASRGTSQNVNLNLLEGLPTDFDSTSTVYVNATNDAEVFNIPVTPFQRLTLKYTTPAIIALNSGIQMKYQTTLGSVVTEQFPFVANKSESKTVIVPDGAVLAQLSIYKPASIASAKVTGVVLSRQALVSPSVLMKISDVYEEGIAPVEYIEAHMLTKTYDYQAAASFKRLFYWGADLVTPRQITAEARPVGRKNSVTWGDLEKYTWAELAQGMWGNPLSWLNRSTSELSITSENVDVSENGRFYVKLRKNLRFRQIAFYLKLTTLGTKDSGPAKIFGLTTLVNPKKDTIDTAT